MQDCPLILREARHKESALKTISATGAKRSRKTDYVNAVAMDVLIPVAAQIDDGPGRIEKVPWRHRSPRLPHSLRRMVKAAPTSLRICPVAADPRSGGSEVESEFFLRQELRIAGSGTVPGRHPS